MTLQNKMNKYLFWVDSTIWNIVQNLTDEEYDQDFYENDRSLQKRYAHLARNLWEWYHYWIGQEGVKEPDFMNMSREKTFTSIKEFSKLFANMIEERTVNQIEIDTGEAKAKIGFDEILFHLVNHATYHRGQIVMGLRILGKDVVMTDYDPHQIQLAKQR